MESKTGRRCEVKICAQCGNEIPVGESYFKVCDNFLQRRYFDAEDGSDNVFCSKDCLCEALSVMEFEVLPDGGEGGTR